MRSARPARLCPYALAFPSVQPNLIAASNDGQHDFGYPCFMPREIIIDGLVIDDRNHPKDYQGPYFFSDPDGASAGTAVRPFSYRLTEQVTIRNLTTSSGLKPRLSLDPEFNPRVVSDPRCQAPPACTSPSSLWPS